MDRRRMILVAFAIVGIIALADVYVNGVGVFEQPFLRFSVRIEEQAPTASATREASYPSANIERLVLKDEAATLILTAEDVDEVQVSAQVKVYSRSEDAALRFLEESQLEMAVEAGSLLPHVTRPSLLGISKVEVVWTVTAPREMEIDVDYRYGVIQLSGSAAPVTVSTTGTVAIRDVEGPVQVTNGAGNVVVNNVIGDVSVESTFGVAEVQKVTGNLAIKNSAGSVSVSQIGGNVTFSGSMGDFVATGVGGSLTARHEMGQVRVTDISGEVDLNVRMGSATVRPGSAAPITANVSQGDLNIILPRVLVDQYRFQIEGERVSLSPQLAARQQAEDGHLIRVNVPTGSIRIETQ